MSHSNWFSWRGSVLTLNVHVLPGSRSSEFVGIHGGALKIRLKCPPVDGRANAELIEYLAAAFGVARARVLLVRGTKTRQKSVRIDTPLLPRSLIDLGLLGPEVKRRDPQ